MAAQLLIINPNTSESVSQTLLQLALGVAGPRCQVRVQTARLGARYISDELSFAIAGHALLDAYAFDRAQPSRARPDAVLIGCFGDPGLLALRQLCEAPVLGLAQASLQAARAAGRYAVITGGQAWVPMLHRLVVQLGLDDQLTGVWAVDKTGPQLAADPITAVRELAGQCEPLLAADSRLQTLLLGGAALGGLAPQLQALLHERGLRSVQVLDSVASSLQAAVAQAEAFAAKRTPASPGQAAPMHTVNLSPELQQLLASAQPS